MKFIRARYLTEYYFKVPSEVNLEDENVIYQVKWNQLRIYVLKPNLTTPEERNDDKNVIKEYHIEPSNDGAEDMKWPQEDEDDVLDSEEDDWLDCYMTEEEIEQDKLKSSESTRTDE